MDFWKPAFISLPTDKGFPVTDFLVLENFSNKYSEINNEILKKQHSEYVGAISWWIAFQQKNGNGSFKSIPENNLYEMIAKACGSCGEATGFRLITSRFGFNSHATSKSIDSLKENSLPAVITWRSEGRQHAAVILEKSGKDIWIQTRFLENSKPVFLEAGIPKQAKVWILERGTI